MMWAELGHSHENIMWAEYMLAIFSKFDNPINYFLRKLNSDHGGATKVSLHLNAVHYNSSTQELEEYVGPSSLFGSVRPASLPPLIVATFHTQRFLPNPL